MLDPTSILFITLDSCRFDTFERAVLPNLKGIGDVHKAKAPGNFTFASHAAMFVGFTPGIPDRREALVLAMDLWRHVAAWRLFRQCRSSSL